MRSGYVERGNLIMIAVHYAEDEIVTLGNKGKEINELVEQWFRLAHSSDIVFLMQWELDKLYISELIARLEHWKTVI